MKKAIRTITIALVILAFPLLTLAQNPPHPNGGNDPTSGGNTPVGGAPIGGGLVMMMVMGVAYGTKKVYDLKKS